MISVGFVSCGDDDGGSRLRDTQLVQDVRLTQYELQESSWSLNVSYFDGGKEKLSKTNSFVAGKSKDKIERVLDSGKFFLVTNGVKAEKIVISPDGELEDSQSVEQRLTGCELVGESEISGKSTHLELELDWTLNAQLKGDGCSTNTDMKRQYVAFIDGEVARLNLKSAADLFVSMEQAREEASSISLKLSIRGEINPEALKEGAPQ